MKTTIATTIFLAAASFTMAQTTPQVGAVAPAVTLPSNDGRQVSWTNSRGNGAVLYFSQKDFPVGATRKRQTFSAIWLNSKTAAPTSPGAVQAHANPPR